MRAPSRAALLGASLILAGCGLPAGPPRALPLDRASLVLTPPPWLAGRPLLALDVAPLGPETLQHVTVELLDLDNGGAPAAPVLDVGYADLGRQVKFAGLRANGSYRVVCKAFAGEGTQATYTQISDDAASTLDLTVGTDDAPTVAALPVRLQDAPTLRVKTAAGDGLAGYVDDVGPAARFDSPHELAVANGNVATPTTGHLVAIADTGNHCVRVFGPNGAVIAVIGAPGVSGAAAAGPVSYAAARFSSPKGVSFGSSPNEHRLYVADAGNHCVRMVDLQTQQVGVLVGTPGASGTDATHLNQPSGVALINGRLYIADTLNHRIRRTPNHTGFAMGTSVASEAVAGAAGTPGAIDHASGSSARFDGPTGLCVYQQTAPATVNFLYVADTNNSRVREIDLTAGGFPVRTYAGGAAGWQDATHDALAARFDHPQGIYMGIGRQLYVADTLNHAVRKVYPNGTVKTLAGGGPAGPGFADGPGPDARFDEPRGIVQVDAQLYVADTLNHRLRRIE